MINTFKKCDMHVHSSSDGSRDYSKANFIETILNSDLDVIAITDHNMINLELIYELSESMLKRDKYLIPGVELNLKLKDDTIKQNGLYVPDNTNGKYFHGLIWCDMKDIGDLSKCITELLGNADSSSEHLDNHLNDKSGHNGNISTNIINIPIYLEELQDKLININHIFVAHENKSNRNLSNYLPRMDSKGNICNENERYKEKLFYYSNAMAIEGGEKSHKHISLSMAEELKTTVSALLFSDAKQLKDIGKRYTWIDFDGDIDSLLLAISDPESRIRTSDECSDIPQTNTNNYLQSVDFDIYIDKNFEEKTHVKLNFSPGYNGIIGSRGSGKSMLARILYKGGLEDYSKLVDINSIKYTICNGSPSLNRPECLFLSQGELEYIFQEQGYESIELLDDKIKSLKEKATERNARTVEEIERLLDLQLDLLNEFIDQYETGVFYIDFLNKPEPSGITILEPVDISTNDTNHIDNNITILNNTKNTLSSAIKMIGKVAFTASFPESKELFKELLSEVNGIKDNLITVNEQLEKLISDIKGLGDNPFISRTILINEYINMLHINNMEQNTADKNNYMSNEKNAIEYMQHLIKLRIAINQIDKTIESLYKQMISPVEPVECYNDDDVIRIELNFKSDYSYNENINQLLKHNKMGNSQYLVLACMNQQEIEKVKSYFNNIKIKKANNIKEYLNKYTTLLKDTVRVNKEYDIKIYMNGNLIDNMSPGMQAEALLKLFLHDGLAEEGNMLLILDQPEDNLDVKTISNTLINRIKKLKLNIQIFVVSHSAPLIVNGDARNLIICTNENGIISYKSGTLNGEGIKESIADILDGGERYLKMRLNKYNFQYGDQ